MLSSIWDYDVIVGGPLPAYQSLTYTLYYPLSMDHRPFLALFGRIINHGKK
jgi:hypothetical protein